jgi:translation initiation factor 2 subunit 3
MSNIDSEIINDQPTINIGMIGSVSNGKSSIVQQMTGIKTQRHSHEQKRNITIKLGYANAKIFKCPNCEPPKCYKSYSSMQVSCNCNYCGENMKLIRHVSFVDCPGHFMLMATMLNGTCIMDSTILVEAANNKNIPSPQTAEHIIASDILNLNNEIVCMNKIDLVSKDVATKKINELEAFIENTIAKNSPIIPIVANYGINTDILCEYICTKIKEPVRDLNTNSKMIIIRSFNINHQNTKIKDLKGGVIGGTITKGILKVGDNIKILPGMINRLGDGWQYEPIISSIQSINSEKNELEKAIPGGLIGVQLLVDPALTADDGLVGNIVLNSEIDEGYKIFEVIRVDLELLDNNSSLKKDDLVMINHNSCNIKCRITKIRLKNNKAELKLIDKPICAKVNDYVVISKTKTGSEINIIGRCKISQGDESTLKN